MEAGNVREILRTGDFERLLQGRESGTVDFTGQPYWIGDQPEARKERARFELAKDVTAFANADGGIIVIGDRTEQNVDERSDEAVEITLMDRTLVQTSEYEDILNARVYPRLRGTATRSGAHAEGRLA